MPTKGCNASGCSGASTASSQSTIVAALPPHSTHASFHAQHQSQSQSQAFSTETQPLAESTVASTVPINQLTPAEMESLISPVTKRRSENLVLQEVRLLIKEIRKRRHIIYSKNQAQSRWKRRAWEEVANSLALKRPHEPRQSGKQVSHSRLDC